jgi:hypothetical protein
VQSSTSAEDSAASAAAHGDTENLVPGNELVEVGRLQHANDAASNHPSMQMWRGVAKLAGCRAAVWGNEEA